MAEAVEEPGTRYEIHVQNEDGTSTGDVIVIYSNDSNDPAQVQELVTKALAELAKQNQEQAVIVADNGDGTAVQTEVFGGQNIVNTDGLVTRMEDEVVKVEFEASPAETVVTKMDEQVLKVEIDAPDALSRQEVYTALKPEELETMGMVQVDNEFTVKAVPYRLQAVEPEELMDIEQDLKLKKRGYGRKSVKAETSDVDKRKAKDENVIRNESALKPEAVNNAEELEPEVVNNDNEHKGREDADNNEDNEIVKVKSENDNTESKIRETYSCSYEGCSFQHEDEILYQRHLKSEHEVVSPFTCSHCEKEFKLELSLHIHLLGHKEIPALGWEVGMKVKKHYTCVMCDYQSFYKRTLVHHLKEEHGIIEVFACEKCKIAFSSAEELQIHFGSLIHEENQWTVCRLCGASSKNISQHMKRIHSDEKPYTCEQCGYKCKFSGALKAHMLIHSSERAFRCDQCDYSARSKDQLKRHAVVHSTVKDHQCPLCAYATQTIYRLKKHMKIHTNVAKGYQCILCDFSTHDKMILKQHKVEVHSKKLNLACKDCDLTFGSVQELKVHSLSVHKCANNWFCKYCEFSCATRRDLGKHMQVHVGKHRYVCKICGYSCRQSNPFKRHLARHSKVKGFSCSVCNYSCTDKYDLEKHLITHSESKSVSCPDCSYTCRYKAQLVRHKKLVHDDVKPYFCTFCSYTTKSPQNLKNHMHLHAEKKPHQCVLCDFSACQKSNLKRHMQTHLKKAQIVYVQ